MNLTHTLPYANPSSSVTVYLRGSSPAIRGYSNGRLVLLRSLRGWGFVVDSWSVTGSDFASGNGSNRWNGNNRIKEGWQGVFAFSKNDVAATFDNGSSPYISLNVPDITDYGIFYGDTWWWLQTSEYQTDRFAQMGNKGVWVYIAELKRTTSNLRLTRFKTWLITTSVTTGLNF